MSLHRPYSSSTLNQQQNQTKEGRRKNSNLNMGSIRATFHSENNHDLPLERGKPECHLRKNI